MKKQAVKFVAWRKDPKTGEKIWAKDFGYKAWPIPVGKKDK